MDSSQSRERIPSLKPGHWIWDEYTDGLMFIGHSDKDKVQPEEVTTALSISTVTQMRDVMFKHIFGSNSVAKFKKNFERKAKQPEENVVLLQDCKDVAIYSCDVKMLSKEFIILFHSKTVDKFLRSLIVYFQFYLQLWDKLQLRRIEAGRKLRQPRVTAVEDTFRDDLSDLRCMVAREFAAILCGVGDARKFHHMKGENNLSLSDKDRKHFELFYKMTARVVWIALKKKNLALIERELHRLLRTDHYSFVEHDDLKREFNIPLPEEVRILYGKTCVTEKKLLTRTPLIQELIFDTHDYRMLAIGVTDVEDRTARQTYLEIAYTAPEELLEELNVGVGLLGVRKKFLDPLLNEDLSATKKRDSVLKETPEFTLPPFEEYDDTKINDTLPKMPCRYKESEATSNARKDQCKMWQEYVKRQGQYPKTPSVSDRISTPSYSTLRSMTKSGSSSSKDKKSEQLIQTVTA